MLNLSRKCAMICLGLGAVVAASLARINRHPIQVAARPDVLPDGCWDSNADLSVISDASSMGSPPPRGTAFVSQGQVWIANGVLGPAGTATAPSETLTYSFVPDGTLWGGRTSDTCPANRTASVLDARMISGLGGGSTGDVNLDKGRELFRQAFAAWSRACGVRYQEVVDTGAPMHHAGPETTGGGGNFRIGGYNLGQGTRGTNRFPMYGGDMVVGTYSASPSIDYMWMLNDTVAGGYYTRNHHRYARNVFAHEHGHGLGLGHVAPLTGMKLMEPLVREESDFLGIDERRGASYNYGDRYSGNHSAEMAHDFGTLASTDCSDRKSVIERFLSTNGNSESLPRHDWFKFTIGVPMPTIVIKATPIGGSYVSGIFDGAGSDRVVYNAQNAGLLRLRLVQIVNGNEIELFSIGDFNYGVERKISASSMPAGIYYIEVYDEQSGNVAENVQLYDLEIRVPGGLTPPVAVAGVDKRVRSDRRCYFMGDINSQGVEAGTKLVKYEWDFTNDGVYDFSSTTTAETYFVYPSPASGQEVTYVAKLRVTDSNGMTATSTINVTVWTP